MTSSDGQPPCLFVIAYNTVDAVAGLGLLITHVWLLRYGAQAEENLIKSRSFMSFRMKGYMKIVYRVCIVQAALATFGTTLMIPYETYLEHGDTAGFSLIGFGLLGFAFSLALIPGYTLCVMYWADAHRLLTIVEDFKSLMFLRPFNYGEVGPAYISMKHEFEEVRGRFERALNVLIASYSFSIGALYLNMIYFREVMKLDLYLSAAQPFFDAALISIEFLPTVCCIWYSAFLVNDCIDALTKQCVLLVGSSAGEVYSSIPASPAFKQGALLQHRRVTSTSASLEEGAARIRHDCSLDAMKLAFLMKQEPCGLYVLGRRVSSSDAVTLVSALLLGQIINLLGLGSA